MKFKRMGMAAVISLTILAASCSTPKNIAYIQNAKYGEEELVVNLNRIKIQPQDKLSIVVTCKESELARLFNLVQTQNRVGQEGADQSNGAVSAYTVDSNGDIEFPILGKLHVAGLNREQLSALISRQLIEGKWISDPIVTVEYANLHFTVVGEVKSPGTYPITNDRVTLLEAISRAGDLTPYGEREITVVREQDGKRSKYLVDLRDNNMFESPAYYIQQNDVIYVQPNRAIARQAEDNPNNLKSIGLWTSIASFLMSVAVLIFK